jgi:hypothetical protein
LFKNFVIRENTYLQFRAEAFNALNNVKFFAPDMSSVSPTFATLQSADRPRVMQLALRFNFQYGRICQTDAMISAESTRIAAAQKEAMGRAKPRRRSLDLNCRARPEPGHSREAAVLRSKRRLILPGLL